MRSLRSLRSIGLAWVLAISALVWSAPAGAETGGASLGKQPRWGGAEDLSKVSSHLLEARQLAREGKGRADIEHRLPFVRLRDGRLEIEIRFDELTEETLGQLEQMGVEVDYWSERWGRVVGWCDPEQLDEIAAMPEVATVHPNYGARSRTGSVTSQGDASINADDARAAFDVSGRDVGVGILSDSFHVTPTVLGSGSVTGTGCSRTLSGSNPQASADLPPSVVVLDNCDSTGPGDPCLDGHSDEGAALAEIVHDLAPAADLAFHTAFRNEADFADGIGELAACGADVIFDDVIYFAEPMFQDGIIAQAVEDAVAGGAVYFSAAGNEAGFGVGQAYVDADPGNDWNEDEPFISTNGVDLHAFAGGDRFAAVRVPDGCGIDLVLQWNEPFSGVLGPGSARDMDLYLCSADSLALNSDDPPEVAACEYDGAALASSLEAQGCGTPGFPAAGDPFEIVSWTNTSGSPVTGYLAVDHYCGDQQNVFFRVVSFASGPGCSFADAVRQSDCTQVVSGQAGRYCFESGVFEDAQIYGHPAAASVRTVGAVFYGEIDSGGSIEPPTGQIDVEPSSSLGGALPFYFDASGAALAGAPVTRLKPNVAAPEGINTTFFGTDIAYDTDAFPNFFGTSAAVPHAVAVAALMLDRNPTMTPADIGGLLASSSVDIETAGWDALSGDGLVDAYEAVLATPGIRILEVEPDVLDFGLVEVGSSVSRSVTIGNRGSLPLSVSRIASSDPAAFVVRTGGASPCADLSPTVPAKGSCTIRVTYSPTAAVQNETLTIESDSAIDPIQTVTLAGRGFGGCSPDFQNDVVVPNTTDNTTKEYLGCVSVTAGPYTVGPAGNVTFKAGSKIVLREGFRADGRFKAVLDAILLP